MRQTTHGFMLITALMVLTGSATLMVVSLTRSVTELLATNRFVASQQAFFLAEAGLDQAVQWISTQPSPPSCPGFLYPCSLTPFGGAQTLGTGSYSVGINLPASNANSAIDHYEMTVTGTTAGISATRTLQLTIRTESFARFAVFTDTMETATGKKAWIGSNSNATAVKGPLHTNGQLHIWGNPVFDGPVSSVASTLDCKSGPLPCAPEFPQGLTLGAAPIPMPNPSLNELQDNASLVLTGNTTIELAGTSILVNGIPYSVSSNPVVFVDGGTLTLVGGELNGQLTLASEEDVVIAGDVRYTCDAADPAFDLDCIDAVTGQVQYNDDVLGIVAKNNIRISASAPFDVTVQATLMAVQGSYGVEQYDVPPPKGTVRLFGGFIEKEVGFFSRSNALGEKTSGYSHRVTYDNRLLNLSPPYFPTTGRYESLLWQEQEP